MKIAICFYGQPRLFKQGFEIIKNFIDCNNEHSFDIFFHTWYDKNLVGQHYQCSPWRNIPQSQLLIDNNLIDNLIELYKPKKYLYESPITFDLTNIKNSKMYNESSDVIKTCTNNTISCIYSKYQVSKLLQDYITETDEKYEIVISIRFDILKKLDFKIEEMLNQKINTMNVLSRLYISDHIIITNYELFLQYSNTYENLDNILENINYKKYLDDIKCGYQFVVETLVTANLLIYHSNLYDIIYLNDKIPCFY
jgi:hypothetical protein